MSKRTCCQAWHGHLLPTAHMVEERTDFHQFFSDLRTHVPPTPNTQKINELILKKFKGYNLNIEIQTLREKSLRRMELRHCKPSNFWHYQKLEARALLFLQLRESTILPMLGLLTFSLPNGGDCFLLSLATELWDANTPRFH